MTSPAQLRRSAFEPEREAEGASRTETAGVEIGLNAAIVAVADNEPVVLVIRDEPDAGVKKIVQAWPSRFESPRAAALGLSPDPDFGSVLRQYVQHHAEAVTHPAARQRLGL